MKRALAAAMLVPLAAMAEPITLKGLAPGMTKAQIEEAHPGFTSRCKEVRTDPTTTEVCVSIGASRADLPALVTFAGVRANYYAANLLDGVAHTIIIAIDAGDFAQAESAVSEKYGQPAQRKTSTVTNRMGAAFDQVSVEWRREGSILAGAKRGATVEKGAFTLTSERALKDHAQQRDGAAKANAKDM